MTSRSPHSKRPSESGRRFAHFLAYAGCSSAERFLTACMVFAATRYFIMREDTMVITIGNGGWACPSRSFGTASVIALASVLTLVSGSANAVIINQLVDFEISNQQIWAGSAPTFETVLHSESFNQTLGIDKLESFSLPLVGSLGQYGIQAGVTVDVAAGVASRLSNFHLGTVNVDFPINVTLDFPDQVNAGETFTISSSFAVAPGAGFTSTANQSELSFGTTTAHIAANATAKACFVGCPINETLPIARLDIPAFDLITQTKDATTINIDLPNLGQPAAFVGKPTIPGSGIDIAFVPDLGTVDGIIDFVIAETTNFQGKITVPDLSQTGELTAPATLSGKMTDVFTDIKVDLDSFLSPPAPPLGFGPVAVSGAKAGIDIFDASFVAKMIADQALEFLGSPSVSLDLGTLGTVDLALGGSVDITVPTNVDQLQITPTYVLDNTFTNTTVVAASKQTEVTVGAIELFFPRTTIIGETCFGILGCVGPLVIGPFQFEETIFGPETVADVLFDTLLSVSTDTNCLTNPQFCVGLNLLRPGSNSKSFQDQQSFAFQAIAGSSIGISVVSGGGDHTAVPEPPALGLIMLGLGMVAALRRRRIEWFRCLSVRPQQRNSTVKGAVPLLP